VDKELLNQRIAKFKVEYLNTPIGREHLRSETEEPKEVQSIFEKLRTRQNAGEDITDDTLRQLLPHLNTKGNKQRNARISTWPCVTKDVKSWFEGAEWKKPEDWPAVAAWLLDIAEAGKKEDWAQWKALAQQSVQKGFACGFITPIVHCLNLRLPVINSKVVRTYKEVAPILGLAPEISPSGLSCAVGWMQ
jgi:5-methylcytosine-specific restriction protein B